MHRVKKNARILVKKSVWKETVGRLRVDAKQVKIEGKAVPVTGRGGP
jgi:hypothetical protein